MMRQRIKLRTPLLAYLVRVLTIVLALGLFWYGLMVLLLAVKVPPHTVNSLSAYRTLYNDVVGLHPSDFTTLVRFAAGAAGLLAFLLLLYVALGQLPRPYLARSETILDRQERGRTVVKPRAIERVAEFAARGNRDVASASGRLGEEQLNLDIDVRRAGSAAETLSDVRQRVSAALERHQLPTLPVNVTLTGYDRKTRRELS